MFSLGDQQKIKLIKHVSAKYFLEKLLIWPLIVLLPLR